MLKQYLTQAIASLRENPLTSILAILGTALSVAMLLVLMLTYQVRTASYAPVSNRSNMLYVSSIEGQFINGRAKLRVGLGNKIVREVFYKMETPVAVSAASSDVSRRFTTVPGVKKARESAVRLVDASFWKIFDVRFVAGKPFAEEEFQSAIPIAVVDERIARELYGTADIVGRTIQLDYIDYTICGVIQPVTKAANEVYGEIWIPYSTDKGIMENGAEGVMGELEVNILVDSSTDQKKVKDEAKRLIEIFNSGQVQWAANIIGQPFNNFKRMFYDVYTETLNKQFVNMLILALFFLFLPIFNLLGITFSQIRKRRPEIGLRKAFGATTRDIVVQVFWENLVITLIGSVIGLLLSFLFFFVAKDGLLERTDVTLQPGMLIQPMLFVSAILISLLINTLSAGIPAWRVTKTPVVDSLNENVQSQ